MVGVLLALRASARRFGLLLAVSFLAVLTLTAFGHHCHLAAGGAAGRKARARAVSHGSEASSSHSCLACLWEQGTAGADVAPPLTLTLARVTAPRANCPCPAEVAAPAPLRSSRAPPARSHSC